MSEQIYTKVIQKAQALSLAERMKLINELSQRIRAEEASNGDRPRWEDYAGSFSYPMCGEDAQDWVARTRTESDEIRRVDLP